VNEVANFLGADFEVFAVGLPAINDGGHAPGGAATSWPRSDADCVRGYAFNGTDFIVKSFVTAAHQLVRPPLNSNSEFTDELL